VKGDRAAEIGGALQARLSEIRFPLDPPIEREIQRHVCAYADELKALGLPPERVVVAVKRPQIRMPTTRQHGRLIICPSSRRTR
jgi:hypothetical protein